MSGGRRKKAASNNMRDIKILSPVEFSGTVHGDWGYEIDGEKSDRGYSSRDGAYKALWRAVDKLDDIENN